MIYEVIDFSHNMTEIDLIHNYPTVIDLCQYVGLLVKCELGISHTTQHYTMQLARHQPENLLNFTRPVHI